MVQWFIEMPWQGKALIIGFAAAMIVLGIGLLKDLKALRSQPPEE